MKGLILIVFLVTLGATLAQNPMCPRDGLKYPSYTKCNGYQICIDGQLVQKVCDPPTYYYNCRLEICQNITHCCAPYGNTTSTSTTTVSSTESTSTSTETTSSETIPISTITPTESTTSISTESTSSSETTPISTISPTESTSTSTESTSSSETTPTSISTITPTESTTSTSTESTLSSETTLNPISTTTPTESASTSTETSSTETSPISVNFTESTSATPPESTPSTPTHTYPTSSIEPTSSSTVTTLQPPTELCSQEGITTPDVSDCRSYYKCKNGQLQKQTCKGFLVWNCMSQSCTLRTFTPCCPKDPIKHDEDDNCLINGIKVPNPFTCNKYFECKEHKIVEKTCPSGKTYHWLKMKCVDDKYSLCATGSTTPTPPPTSPESCSKEGSTISNIDDCTSYYKCTNSVLVQQFCPKGTVWNCVESKCINSIFTPCCINDLGNGNYSSSLECKKDGQKIPSLVSCKKYYQCDKHKMVEKECKNDETFNWIKNKCVKDKYKECAKTPSTITPTTVTQSPARKCSEEGSTLPDNYDCKSYYQCIDGELVKTTCSNNFVYNCISNTCTYNIFSPCCPADPQNPIYNSTTYCANKDIKIPSLISCNKYYQCTDKHTLIEKECPKDETFNWVKKKCVKDKYKECASENNNPITTLSPPTFPPQTCSNKDVVANINDCTSYYKCKDGILLLQECPEGKVWNCLVKTCTDNIFTPCCNNDPKYPSYNSTVECKGDIKIPNWFSCESYYQCEKNKMVLKQCPKEKTFNWKKNECVNDKYKICLPDITTVTPPATLPPKQCYVEGSTIPNTQKCNQYYQCKNGKLEKKSCPKNQIWNCMTKSCSYSTFKPCCKDDPEISEIPTTILCLINGIKVPNPFTCNQYFECDKNKIVEKTCPKEQIYDWLKFKCVSSGTCAPGTDGETTVTLPTTNTTPYPLCTQNGIRYPSPGDCQGYLECKDGQLKKIKCVTGENYNCKLRKCIRNGHCCTETKPTTAGTGKPTETTSVTSSPTETTSGTGISTENTSVTSSPTENTSGTGISTENTSVTSSPTETTSGTGTPPASTSVTSSPTETTSGTGSSTENTSVTSSPTETTSETGTPPASTSVTSSPIETTSGTGSSTENTSVTSSPTETTSETGTPPTSTSVTSSPTETTSETGSSTENTSVTSSPTETTSETGTPPASTSVTSSPTETTSGTGSSTENTSVTSSPTETTSETGTPPASTSVTSSPTETTSGTGSSTENTSVTSSPTETTSETGTPPTSTSVTSSPTETTSETGSSTENTSVTSSPTETTSETGTPSASTSVTSSPTETTSGTGSSTENTSVTSSPTETTSETGTPPASTSVTSSPTETTSETGSSTENTSVTSSPTETTSETGTPPASTSVTSSPTETTSGTGSSTENTSVSSSPTETTSETGSSTESTSVTSSPTDTTSGTGTPTESTSVTSSPTETTSGTGSSTENTSVTSSPTETTSETGTPPASTSVTSSPTETTSGTGSSTENTSVTSSPTETTSGTGTPPASTSVTSSPTETTSGTGSSTENTSVTSSPTETTSETGTPPASTSVTSSPTETTSGTGSSTENTSVTSSPTETTSETGTPPDSTSVTSSPTETTSGTGSSTENTSVTSSPTETTSETGTPPDSTSVTSSPTETTSGTGSTTENTSVTSSPTETTSETGTPPASTSVTSSPTETTSGTGSSTENTSVSSSPTETTSGTGSSTESTSVTSSPTETTSGTGTPTESTSVTSSPTETTSGTGSSTESTSVTSSPTETTSGTGSSTENTSVSSSPTETTSGTGSSTESTSVTSSPNPMCSKNGTKYPSYTDCSGYQECINGQLVQKKCDPPSYNYNCRTEVCENITHCCAPSPNTTSTETSQSTEPTTPSIFCPQDGVTIPDGADCRSYYKCRNGQLEKQTCPLNLVWNCVLKMCMFKWFAPCCRNDPNPPSTGNSTDCLFGIKVPNPFTCNEYFECYNHKIVERKCPAGQTYDWIQMKCVSATTGQCAPIISNGTTPSPNTSPTTVSTIEPPNSSCNKPGKYSDINDCHSYYECKNGLLVKQKCGFNMVYNCWLSMCTLSIGVNHCCKPNNVNGSENSCLGIGSKVPDLLNCQNYYECSYFKTVLKSCNDGQYFDVISKSCKAQNEAKCIIDVGNNFENSSTVTESTPTTLPVTTTTRNPICIIDGIKLPDINNCSKYMQCIEGQLVEQTCPDGSYWHCFTKQCTTTGIFTPCCYRDPNRNNTKPNDYCLINGLSIPKLFTCNQYYQCKNHIISEITCSTGQRYDWILMKCVTATSGNCASNNNSTIRPYCGVDGTKIPSPSQCDTYLECQNGNLVPVKCPLGQNYNCWSKQCEFTTHCCITTPTPPPTSSSNASNITTVTTSIVDGSTTTSSSGTSTSTVSPGTQTSTSTSSGTSSSTSTTSSGTSTTRSKLCARDGLKYPAPNDCSAYLECQNGKPVKIKCPTGQNYNCRLEKCDNTTHCCSSTTSG